MKVYHDIGVIILVYNGIPIIRCSNKSSYPYSVDSSTYLRYRYRYVHKVWKEEKFPICCDEIKNRWEKKKIYWSEEKKRTFLGESDMPPPHYIYVRPYRRTISEPV